MHHAFEQRFMRHWARLTAYITPMPARYAIALSGGIDSMALTLLMQHGVQAQGGGMVALIVDHQLRAESSEEARRVAAWMTQAGIEHHILEVNWDEKPKSGLQQKARAERYALLEQYCVAHDIPYLLTAHHADDDIETYAMRLGKAGVEGLAGIADIRKLAQVTLLRPLLPMTKCELRQYVLAKGVAWVEDPSNDSMEYERNRVRKELQHTPREVAHIPPVLEAYGQQKMQLHVELAEWFEQALFVHEDGTAELCFKKAMAFSQDTQFYGMQRLLMHLGGREKPVRGHEIERLWAKMAEGKTKKLTLSGMILERRVEEKWLIYREASRMPEEALAQAMLYDGRFIVEYCPHADISQITIRALGIDGLAALKEKTVVFPEYLNYSAKLSLPSIWQLDQLLCVPHIRYACNHEAESWQMAVRFAPKTPFKPLPSIYLPKL